MPLRCFILLWLNSVQEFMSSVKTITSASKYTIQLGILFELSERAVKILQSSQSHFLICFCVGCGLILNGCF
jgi:hypothetical protein